ncbi:MAG: acyl-CoA dehydrogenase family protein [Rhodospirillales bacterium]|nr:acyl-CoA dehydrogenase family protein [Rhodospirillales bacterium]
MDFDLNDDQRLLRDSVDRLIADRYDFEARRRFTAEPEGWSRANWVRFAEQGWLGLPFTEASGGFGGGAIEIALVMEAFGRGLVVEPYLASILLAGRLLEEAGEAALVRRIAEGELLGAFAHLERHSGWDLEDVATKARPRGDTWHLTGTKCVVLHGDCADVLLVTARTAGAQRDRDGIGVFLITPDAPGLTRHGVPTQDAQRVAEITMSDTPARQLAFAGDALATLERVRDQAIAALCAEAVGVMEQMHATTVDYLKTRHQFGRAIGEFQVLQHRAVDMYVALEQARSMALFATLMAAEADSPRRRAAISAAKVQIGRSGRLIGQEAIQLHGGIAMTIEYKVGHYFKRMTAIEEMFGNADTHLEQVATAESIL